uniref:NADH-ubiquinone oxidoreductase chain 2 n=1 Tax=Enithares tibialis TaxID=575841 RepID=C5HIT9_9HEMI|nr:NADH dehydrogenase subunit 2 [Enithares tibialis]ACJ69534.1 NADH dehydrogenase subunit 2 [Enithares tibialis]
MLMKNSTKTLFMFMMLFSTMMVLSSTNWISMWMGLEINMMSFIPMMYFKKNNSSSESMMSYFMVQSISSIMFLMMIIMNNMIMISSYMMHESVNTIIMCSMMFKMGAAPFHMWMPQVMKKMKWETCTLLMTWQKLAPMSVLSSITNNNNLIMLIALMSTIIGSIGGLNQTSMKMIMAYSSINHLGWMVACLSFDNEMWINYLAIYSIMVIMMTFFFNKMSINFINQMNINSMTMMEKMLYFSMMLSMGGLPPFIGFLPKWMVIQSMLTKSMYMLLLIMMLMTLITLFYYIRMMSTLMLINSTTSKLMLKTNMNNNLQLIMFMINMMLPLIMIINMF